VRSVRLKPTFDRCVTAPMSCELARDYGTPMTQMFGIANECQGFVMQDIPRLPARMVGRSPWAFEWDDLANNEHGFRCSGQQDSCSSCCATDKTPAIPIHW
jgi:hypothetical protein